MYNRCKKSHVKKNLIKNACSVSTIKYNVIIEFYCDSHDFNKGGKGNLVLSLLGWDCFQVFPFVKN